MSVRFTSGLMSFWVVAIALTMVPTPEAAADTMAPSPSWQVTVQGQRMSARVQDTPLETVLREISRRMPLTVSIQGTVAQAPISVRFKNLPLDEGIKKVLEGKEYAIIRRQSSSPAAGQAEASTLREVIVFSAPGSDAYVTGTWTDVSGGVARPSAPALSAIESQPEPGSLMLQLEEMGDLADEDESLPVIARALEDQDARVRAKAMEVLEESFGPIPIRQLARIAETERDPLMRSRALTLLAFRAEGSAGQPLTRALQDPDAEVRELASDLLSQLGLPVPARSAP